MKTTHSIYFKDSTEMGEIDSNSIDLIITSPPYPMIEMWDKIFSSQDSRIKKALEDQNGKLAFELMHEKLDGVWKESIRTLKEGGIICINIGDATRKIGNNFQLFPNHVKISHFFLDKACSSLPIILWRKPTNSPTKFMGSGMLPSNAYVTLEHEYILIFRKGNKRKFKPKSEKRYHSAYFWEERNKWFSDEWDDIKGIPQNLENNDILRERSAAFPIELPYRLINMFSVYGDSILDPFWGTGTTSLAAMILARNSFGFELNTEFLKMFETNIKHIETLVRDVNQRRLNSHIDFIKQFSKKNEIKYTSQIYNFPVMTSQEQNIMFYSIRSVKKYNEGYKVLHENFDSDYE